MYCTDASGLHTTGLYYAMGKNLVRKYICNLAAMSTVEISCCFIDQSNQLSNFGLVHFRSRDQCDNGSVPKI